MQVGWIKYYQCRMNGSNICQSNPMQVKINLRQVESFPNGWNQSHAGWSDCIKGVINQIQVESIKYIFKYRLNMVESIKYRFKYRLKSNTGWINQIRQVEWFKYGWNKFVSFFLTTRSVMVALSSKRCFTMHTHCKSDMSTTCDQDSR